MEPETTTFGPVQMLTVSFVGNHFKGEILPELERLKEAGLVRIIDLLVVRKDGSGAVMTMTQSDLDWDAAVSYGAYIGSLVGFGIGGPEGAEQGAIAGAAELMDGHVFDEEDAFKLTATLPPGTSIGVVLFEHLWAIPLIEAIQRADGVELDNVWITPDDLIRAGLRSSIAGEIEEDSET